MCSRSSAAAGEIKCAKSASDNFAFAMLSRTAWTPAVCERFTIDSSGKDLNSATKLTKHKVANWRTKSSVGQASRLPPSKMENQRQARRLSYTNS